MLATFYRPTAERPLLLTDEPAFPSDRYALGSVVSRPEHFIAADDPEAVLLERGRQVGVVVLNAVNFLTGRFVDVPRLAELAHRQGCVFGMDLAHAIGNVPLQLHDWGVDFAVWCSYKYLNAGPGAVGGCFVHERHGRNADLPRLAGWWGNDPATRFQMHEERVFLPKPGADGWQLSNPPILALAPLRASLELFDRAGIGRLRAKSQWLTSSLQSSLDQLPAGKFTQLTPREPQQRGAMLTLRIHDNAQEVAQKLGASGVVCDFRPPDVIRVTPCPLYNSAEDVGRFAEAFGNAI
jgi:kynureninase